jgi:anthraniloyl-CoA monooxygenase
LEAVANGVAKGALLVAVGGGTALTRRLICEAARLEHCALTLLVEEVEPADAADIAVSAVLSGRTDLVSAPIENVTE